MSIVGVKKTHVELFNSHFFGNTTRTAASRLSAGPISPLGYNAKKTSRGMSFLHWRRRPESDRGIKVLQTSALPLGYGAVNGNSEQSLSTVPLIKKMERITGIEPATSTLARSRSTK